MDAALARAVVCRAITLGLSPPGPKSRRGFTAAPDREALAAASRLLDGGQDGPLSAAAHALFTAAREPVSRLGRRYQALFGHTLRGRVCPFELEYAGGGPALQQAQELANLAGFYRAFGLTPGPFPSERPDHIACQVELYGFLAHKEAWARERGDGEQAAVAAGGARKLLAEHLARFGRAFAVSLAREGAGGFYGRLGELLEAFLATECRRLGAPLGPAVLALRADEPDRAPMACGSQGEDALVQIGGS